MQSETGHQMESIVGKYYRIPTKQYWPQWLYSANLTCSVRNPLGQSLRNPLYLIGLTCNIYRPLIWFKICWVHQLILTSHFKVSWLWNCPTPWLFFNTFKMKVIVFFFSDFMHMCNKCTNGCTCLGTRLVTLQTWPPSGTTSTLIKTVTHKWLL